MSVVFTNTPEPFQPVLSDGIYFTVSSSTYDAQTTFKFRFVYDLFVDGTFAFRGKCSPNPYGLGILDLQQILETYTNSLPVSYYNNTPIYTHQTFPFSRPANDETILYQVKVGYEYASSEISSITGFTGVGNTVGEPAFASDQYKTFRSTMGTNGRATQQDFNILPFVLSGNPVGVYPTTSGLFLTNAPRILDILEDQYFTLGFTNYYLNSGSTQTLLSEPYYVEYNYFDNTGSLILTERYDNTLTNGGGPRTSGCDVYPAMYLINPYQEVDYNTLYVGAGPANLPNLPANCAQYTVQLFGKFTGTTTPIQPSPTPTPTTSPGSVTPSPTPTPSTTPPCAGCREYQIYYTGDSTCLITIVNCNTGGFQTISALPFVFYSLCSCQFPLTSCIDLEVTDMGPCPPPTPSPTRTSSPTPTPSITPTLPECVCVEYEAQSNREDTTTIFYVDCNLVPQTYSLPGFASQNFCACEGSVVVETGVDLLDLGACVPPSPSPSRTPTRTPVTPTRTPTPTLTPGCYKSWNLTECASACSGGICACEGGTSVTKYTNCSVTNITDPFTEIYDNTGLTNPYTADFVLGGVIYNSTGSGVSIVCNVGGPC